MDRVEPDVDLVGGDLAIPDLEIILALGGRVRSLVEHVTRRVFNCFRSGTWFAINREINIRRHRAVVRLREKRIVFWRRCRRWVCVRVIPAEHLVDLALDVGDLVRALLPADPGHGRGADLDRSLCQAARHFGQDLARLVFIGRQLRAELAGALNASLERDLDRDIDQLLTDYVLDPERQRFGRQAAGGHIRGRDDRRPGAGVLVRLAH